MTDAMQSAPWLYALARVFEAGGAPIYLVGGAVRNPLMGLPISDIDVCGTAHPEEVCALCEGTEVRASLRAARFGTVELHVVDENGRHMAEYTTFREDSYRCGHKPEAVRFTDDIAVDALRRDFSVNAMYRRLTTRGLGSVIDPTGGMQALRRGELHTVTDDPDKVLRDDGLRIMRAARFQAELALTPTAALMASLRRYAPLLGDIAPERVRDELQKILLADLRYPMLRRAGAESTEAAGGAESIDDSPNARGAESGLNTLWQAGAWEYALGGLRYNAQAVRAVSEIARAERGAPLERAGDAGSADDVRRAGNVRDMALERAGGAGSANSASVASDTHGAALERVGGATNASDTSGANTVSPLSLRMAVLGLASDADELERLMRRLRFAQRDTRAAAGIVNIAARLALGDADICACAQAGRAALGGALAALTALQKAGAQASGSPSAYHAAATLCRKRIAELADLPATLKELDLSGDDLLPLARAAGLSGRAIGATLSELLLAAQRGEVSNSKEALAVMARELIKAKAQ